MARVLIEGDRLDEAVRVLQGLKRRGPTGGAVHLLLGRALLAKGLPELAEEELRAATSLPLGPADEIDAAYRLGCVLEAAGKPTEALEVYHGILQKDLHYADVERRYRRLKQGARPAKE